MYVSPFWCYRASHDGAVLTNTVTRRTARVPEAFLQLAQRLHAGKSPGSEDGAWVGLGAELGLFFADVGAAEDAFRAADEGAQAALPLVDQIELTNRCPYTCQMCPRTLSMDRALGEMSMDLFESIVRQIRPAQDYVGLHHFGESLVHKRLHEMIALARAQGLRTGLSCNPPSLTPALAQRILDAGISFLTLSLDSLDPKVYRDIRGKAASFERADENLRALVRLRDAGEQPAVLCLQMIHMHCNAEEADRFLEYAKDLGVDRAVVVRLGRWDLTDEQLEPLGEVTAPGYLPWCTRPRTSVIVLWDGRVAPCCHDYNGDVVLGDLTQQTLAEVWQSAAARAFREESEQTALCRRCAFSRSWREGQRDREGFFAFHKDRTKSGRAYRWQNPASVTSHEFDNFDVWRGED